MPPKSALSLFSISALFLLFTALLSALFHLGGAVPGLSAHLTEVYALLFLFTPIAWFSLRKEQDFTSFGAIPRGLLWGLAVALPVLGLYVLAHWLFFNASCTGALPFSLGRQCHLYRGAFAWPLSSTTTLNLLAVHIIAVALPEEFFYRGFLLPLLLRSKQLRDRKGLAPVAIALFLQALFFGLGHALVDGNPLRMAVFFPGLLFGIVAIKSKGLVAPIVIHGLANFTSEVLERGWFITS